MAEHPAHHPPTDTLLPGIAGLYGLLAEYAEPDEVIAAARRAHDAGYRRLDAFAPFPIDELSHAVGKPRTRLPLITLAGGAVGALGGYGMQYWTSVFDFPLNVGGRPLHSWPAFIPITFELTILCAAIATVAGMCILNRLPTPHHPLFDVPAFARATQDRFFLCIESTDEQFDKAGTRRLLESTNPVDIYEVPSWRT